MPDIHLSLSSDDQTCPAGRFSITRTIEEGNIHILHVIGDLDLMTADRTSAGIDESVDAGAVDLIMDLSRTDFLAAVGLAVLDHGRRRIRSGGGRFAVATSAHSVVRPIVVMKLEQTLNLAAGVDEVLAAWQRTADQRPNDSQATVHHLIRPA